MINANELRRGNKVISKTHSVLNATFEGLTPQNLVFLKEVSTFETLDKLEPILLTPEILESAGFKVKYGEGDRRSLQSRTLAETEGISVIFYNSDKIFFININGFVLKRPFLKYLHQLQNLYFALTGQELELTL